MKAEKEDLQVGGSPDSWLVKVCPKGCGHIEQVDSYSRRDDRCRLLAHAAPPVLKTVRVVPASLLEEAEQLADGLEQSAHRWHEAAESAEAELQRYRERANSYRVALERVEFHGAGHAVEIARAALSEGGER